MKYMTQQNILIAIGLVLGALVAWGILNSPAAQQKQEAVTQQEEQATATTTENSLETTETSIEVESETATQVTNTQSFGTQQNNANTNTSQKQQEPKELGPRQPATVSPLAALQFFAEAYVAGDQERALTYFAESVRDQYRTSFKEYKGKEHPVVRAYFTGEVGPVELIQPEHGIYEVRVRPFGSKAAYTVNFFFEDGEFVIWEL